VNVVCVHLLYPGIHMEELEKTRRTLVKVAGNRTEQATEAPACRV
jgi:hypothetical protein